MDSIIANLPLLNTTANSLAPALALIGVTAGAAVGLVGGASAANVVAGGRRRTLWRRVGSELGLSQENAAVASMLPVAPILRGIRHGRAVEAVLLPSGLAQISVRIANPRHLLDQISIWDTAAIAGASWLSSAQQQAIGALNDRRRLGSIAVRGSFVTLTASIDGVKRADPAPLRSLFHLAQSVAESVDSAHAASGGPAQPAPTHRRFGPGALMGRRRA